MRGVILLLAVLVPAALTGQAPTFPDYTDAERWQRCTTLGTVNVAAALAYAKDRGDTVEEFAAWYTDLFDDGWGEPGSYDPVRVMRAMRMNWLGNHGAEFEILEANDEVAQGRMDWTPVIRIFGDDEALYGVTLDEFQRLFSVFGHGIAEYHGLEYDQSVEGADWIMVFRRP